MSEVQLFRAGMRQLHPWSVHQHSHVNVIVYHARFGSAPRSGTLFSIGAGICGEDPAYIQAQDSFQARLFNLPPSSRDVVMYQ